MRSVTVYFYVVLVAVVSTGTPQDPSAAVKATAAAAALSSKSSASSPQATVSTEPETTKLPSVSPEVRARIDELNERMLALADESKYAEAAGVCEALLALRRKFYGDTWWETIGDARYLESLRHSASLSAAAQEVVNEADNINQEMRTLFRQDRYAEALVLAERQLAIRKKHLLAEDYAIASSLANVALLHKQLSQYDKARQLYEQSVAGYTVSLGTQHPFLAIALANLAELHRDRGRFDEAERLHREAMAIRLACYGPESRQVARNLNYIGTILKSKGDTDGAEDLLRKSLALYQKLLGEENAPVAAIHDNLGSVLRSRGDLLGAEQHFRRALRIRKKVFGDNHTRTAISLSGLAEILWERGQNTAAEQMAREAIRTWRSIPNEENPHYLATLEVLAVILSRGTELGEATQLCRESLRKKRALYGNDHPRVATALINLADVLIHSGELDEAEQQLREALAMLRKTSGPDSCDVAGIRVNLARVLATRSSPEAIVEAEEHYAAAVEILRRSKDPRLLPACIAWADFLQYKLSQHSKALRVYEEAIGEIERMRTRIAGDELDRARYFSKLAAANPFGGAARACLARTTEAGLGAGITIPQEDARAALALLERGRGRALQDLLDRGDHDLYRIILDHADRTHDAQLRIAIESIRQREQLARSQRLAALKQLEAIRADTLLDDAQKETRVAEIEKDLKRARITERQAIRELHGHASGRIGGGGIAPLTATRIAATMTADELLLMYEIGRRDSFVLALASDGTVLPYPLLWPNGRNVDVSSLQATVGHVLGSLTADIDVPESARSPNLRYAEADLFGALIPSPLQARIRDVARVLLVPDRFLHHLPFETLLIDEVADRRWIDVGPTIVYGPSATLIARGRLPASSEDNDPKTGPELVALGDPNFARSVTSPEKTGAAPQLDSSNLIALASLPRGPSGLKSLSRLPGTRQEVYAIASVFRDGKDQATSVELLLGADATNRKLFQAARNPRFLHLATHGLAEGGRNVYDSSLALSVPEVLSANDTAFLTLGDLLTRWGGRLSGTELVTLSACRSGRGALEAGDGLIGLPWGFQFAGARNVVASLWKIDDTATSLLMTRFYTNMLGRFDQSRAIAGRTFPPQEPMPKPEALHEAKYWLRTLTAEQLKKIKSELNLPAAARGAEFVKRPSAQPSTGRPFADPSYWGAFVFIGNGV